MSNREGPWAFGRVPLTLTFQSEVARRIISDIDSNARSRISIISQYVSEPTMLFEIPGKIFDFFIFIITFRFLFCTST